MRNIEKIRKQFHSPGSGICIKFPVYMLGIMAVAAVAAIVAVAAIIHAFGATFSTVAGVWLGYKLLKLIWRIIRLVLSLSVSVVLAAILVVIISLLVF